MEIVTNFLFLGSKITVDDDYSHEIKRHLLLGRKAMRLKLNIQKTKIMASGPITSWQIDAETVADFIFWAPKSLQTVTAAMK